MNAVRIIKTFIGYILVHIYRIKAGKECYIALNARISQSGLGGVNLGNSVHIAASSRIDLQLSTSKLMVGNNVVIGHHSQIACRYTIDIKDGVLMAPHVFISDHNHGYKNINKPVYMNPITGSKDDAIVIGEGCWLGINSVIVGNVKIGKHCVIATNTVVTKDIPDYCVVAGCPSKIIKRYNVNNNRWESVKDNLDL